MFDPTYGQILFVLALAVGVFILVLRWVRTRLPGDYTVIKVIGGMGLVTLAQLHAGRLFGLDWRTLLLVVLTPLLIGGALITLWQLGEWVGRHVELIRDQVREAQARAARQRSRRDV